MFYRRRFGPHVGFGLNMLKVEEGVYTLGGEPYIFNYDGCEFQPLEEDGGRNCPYR